ncbi:MAG TPA: phosphotransferase [Jatrophihabitans sp.]|uniref:phosphotransferase n=1 Tax=Jatrophihabitans sp. TaxID=1932789 RepID=UPI002F1D5A08
MATVEHPPHEIPLHGGTSNRGLVVRVGDAVHRPQTRASPAVHALLLHLEQVGFDGAPRYLGDDEQGREVLNYLPGEVATEPYPPWALEDDALVSVAELLRRFHQAVASFDPSRHSWLTAVPQEYRQGLISHNDPNLDNVVFSDGRAAALIDFDLASPGSRLWDVALAARLWTPLRDPVDIADQRAERVAERLRLFVDAYGLDGEERSRVAAAASRSHTWCYDIVRAGAEQGQPGYVDYWQSEADQRAERGRRWLVAQQDALQDALR